MTMTSVKDLIQGTYERSNGKLIIHAGGQIIDTKGENDSLFRGFRGKDQVQLKGRVSVKLKKHGE